MTSSSAERGRERGELRIEGVGVSCPSCESVSTIVGESATKARTAEQGHSEMFGRPQDPSHSDRAPERAYCLRPPAQCANASQQSVNGSARRHSATAYQHRLHSVRSSSASVDRHRRHPRSARLSIAVCSSFSTTPSNPIPSRASSNFLLATKGPTTTLAGLQ